MITYTEAKRLVAAAVRGYHDPDYEAAAWAGLHRAMTNHDPESGSFAAYARACMRGFVRNAWRSRQSRAAHVTGAAHDVADCVQVFDTAPDPGLADALADAVDQLTPRQREAVKLVLANEMPHDVAAATMGVSTPRVTALVSAARTRLHRSLGQLHRAWTDQ